MEKTIVKTDNYLLVVDDSEIKDVRPYKGMWHLEKRNILNKFPNYLTDLSECKLVIAHLPLNDSPPLEGVPLLPTIDDKKRPTHFEFEMEDELAIDGHTIIGKEIKTTTNSQGEEVACGQYTYALKIMEIKLKVLPPMMPNYVRISDDASVVAIENFTQEEAEQFGELMKQTFINHWKKRTKK